MSNLSTTAGINSINPIGELKSITIRKLYRILAHKHMVEAIERFKWEGLPAELNQDLIERILYFRGKGAIFKGVDDKYRFLPFTLSGIIDIYGRYVNIIPVLFTGQNTEGKSSRNYYINTNKVLKVAYGIEDEDSEAVILTDSSLEISQDLEPTYKLIAPIISQMVDILVLINIDLVSSAKVFYIVASDEAQKEAIEKEFTDLDSRILEGKRVVVLTAQNALQELNTRDSKDSNRYFQTYQSFENLRKDTLGITNSGTFMKNSIQTTSEVDTNTSGGNTVLDNALRMRKEFCKIANKVFGLSISVELNKQDETSKLIGGSSNNSDRNEGTLEGDE